MAKIQEEKHMEKIRIEKAQRLYQKMKARGFQKVVSASKTPRKLTIPKEPKSALQSRLGTKVPSGLKPSPKKAEKATIPHLGLHPTIPAPFHFATDSRMKSSSSSIELGKSASLTTGEQAQKFFQDARSHYVPDAAKKLTEAHSPLLHTKQRGQTTHKERALSYDERLEAEMAEIGKHTFKALVLDRRIFESNGELGVPKVEAKPLTVPQEFRLELEKKRAALHKSAVHEQEEESEHLFKALPLPAFIKEPVKQLATPPSKKNFKPTLPKSPKLNGGDRASSAPARRQKPHHSELEKQRRNEATAWKKQSKEAARGVTEPEEFHLLTAERGAAYQSIMEEYMRQEEELAKEQTKLKAQPMPDLSKAFQPKILHKPVTEPTPFRLKSVALHEESSVKQQMQQERDQEQNRRSTGFKARALPKSTFEQQPANMINHENRAPVIPLNIALNSDLRAEKRHAFDEKMGQKMAALAMQQEQLAKEQCLQEQLSIQEMRRKSVQEGGMVFIAQPVLKHDPHASKPTPAAKQPTQPRSPKLRLRERRNLAKSDQEANQQKQSKAATGTVIKKRPAMIR
jgi:hypothetical protein